MSAQRNLSTITNRASKVGKPANVQRLTQTREKDQISIVECMKKTKKRKISTQKQDGSVFDPQSPGRLPKKSKQSEHHSDEFLPMKDSDSTSDDNPELDNTIMGELKTSAVKSILDRIDALSSQVQSVKDEHSAQLANLESTINTRLEGQDLRLSSLENQMSEALEQRKREDLLSRVVTLENAKATDGPSQSNEFLLGWLGRVSDRLESRERAEKRLNLTIKGLDTSHW